MHSKIKSLRDSITIAHSFHPNGIFSHHQLFSQLSNTFKRTKETPFVKPFILVKFMKFMPVLIQRLNINKEVGDHNAQI